MKKFLIGTTLLLIPSFLGAIAEETSRYYLSIGGGIALPSDIDGDSNLGGTNYDHKFSTNLSDNYAVGLGYKLKDWRLEFNYSTGKVQTDKITSNVRSSIVPNLKRDVNSYMAYGYKDFNGESKVKPYFGAGIGVATISTEDQKIALSSVNAFHYTHAGDDATVLSYGLKAGIDYEIVDNTSIFTEGTYQNFGSYKAEKSGARTVNYDASSQFTILTGIKFNF